jgi:hypothetical protein
MEAQTMHAFAAESEPQVCVPIEGHAIVFEFSCCFRIFVDGFMADGLKFDNTLATRLDGENPRARANRQALGALMTAVCAEEDTIRLGGGTKAAEAQHAKGRLTVRERLKLLLDQGTELLELGLWAAYGMYGE